MHNNWKTKTSSFFFNFQLVSDVDWSIHWKELTEYFEMKKNIFVIPENEISAVKNSKLRQKMQASLYISLLVIPQDWSFDLFLKPQSETSTA